MKRSWSLIMAGLVLAVLAYLCFYFIGTAHSRSLEKSPEPELAWLKQEFHLGDAEFARISRMHESYMASCMERCHKIDLKNEELKQLLANTNAVTPEIQKTLAEAAQLRADCQKEMLQHFYDVSRTMPPEQGKRYLAWVQRRTVLSDSHKDMHH